MYTVATALSGLKLPAISLGLWHNFGGDTPHESKLEMCRTAFDLGITHFDLANNYGPPPGSAETAFGEILRTEFAGLARRADHLVQGRLLHVARPLWRMGLPQVSGRHLDQSLKRMGLDYVDIFYSHRFDPDTPLEETMGALDHIVRSGQALYVGISSYNSQRTREAAAILKELGTPCLIHQPSYSMLNRWVEDDGLVDTLEELGIGSIVFSPLAQGMLTTKYLEAASPTTAAPRRATPCIRSSSTPTIIDNIRKLNEIAEKRGQTLAQMAHRLGVAPRRHHLGADRRQPFVADRRLRRRLDNLDFTAEELKEIDVYAREADINLWAKSSSAE